MAALEGAVGSNCFMQIMALDGRWARLRDPAPAGAGLWCLMTQGATQLVESTAPSANAAPRWLLCTMHKQD